jgi:putative transposase
MAGKPPAWQTDSGCFVRTRSRGFGITLAAKSLGTLSSRPSLEMLRTFQFRLRPNATQTVTLKRILADNCETYNACLQERIGAWKLQRKSISYRNQQDQITELRKDDQFNWVACDIQRDPLRRVDRAFKAFFKRCKTGAKPGFPRYRSRLRYDSFSFSLPVCRERSIKIPNVGDIRARGGRLIDGRAKLCTVKHEGKRWTASVVCDIGETPPKRVVSRATGIDVGLTTLATLSDGTEIENPRWTKHHEDNIAAKNRALATKKRGSKNRLKAKEALRRAHQAASNARLNYIHHVSKWLVANYDLIAHEDLKISNMAKSRLAKSIMDAAWGILIYQLGYKAESAGVHVVAVNPRGTSQRCSGCAEVVPKRLSQRIHSCPSCGLELSRDHNAARNVLKLGLGMSLAVVQAESMQASTGKSCI